eukprot:scpid70244/ scgid14552/ 
MTHSSPGDIIQSTIQQNLNFKGPLDFMRYRGPFPAVGLHTGHIMVQQGQQEQQASSFVLLPAGLSDDDDRRTGLPGGLEISGVVSPLARSCSPESSWPPPPSPLDGASEAGGDDGLVASASRIAAGGRIGSMAGLLPPSNLSLWPAVAAAAAAALDVLSSSFMRERR